MIEELKQFLMIKYFIPLQVTNNFFAYYSYNKKQQWEN